LSSSLLCFNSGPLLSLFRFAFTLALFFLVRQRKGEIKVLVHRINDCEDEVADIVYEVDEYKDSHNFDWQVQKQSRVRVLRDIIAEDRGRLLIADRGLNEVVATVMQKFPGLLEFIGEVDREMYSRLLPVVPGTAGASAQAALSDSLNGRVYGWLLGRLTPDGRICTMFYGQFTTSPEPPGSDWLFLGRNIEQSLRNTKPTETLDAEGNKIEKQGGGDRVALTEAEMERGRDDRLVMSASSFKSDFAESGKPSSHHDAYYRVAGCNVREINGRYLESGQRTDVPQYRNVKGWTIFRCRLDEIPELGIYVDGCYGARTGPSMAVLMERRAEQAVKDLLLWDGKATEGTALFKRMFAEISRSGTRMVVTDQTASNIHLQSLRADVRSEANKEMLEQLQFMRDREQSGQDERGADETEPSALDAIENGVETSGGLALPSAQQSDQWDEDANAAATAASEVDSVQTMGSYDDAMNEVKVTMARNVNYQIGGQGFPLVRDKLGSKAAESNFAKQEADLAREATARIETRESLLKKARLDAAWCQRKYLESETESTEEKARAAAQRTSTGGAEPEDESLLDLLTDICAVRDASVDALEAMGAWMRFVRTRKHAEAGGDKFSTGALPRDKRGFCVVVAQKGTELFPTSKGITTGARKFRRSQEDAKMATEMKYIGIYPTKAAAAEAFSRAAANVPVEKRIISYSNAPPMFVGMRACRRHYLVRSDGVPTDLPCEQCQGREYAKTNALVGAAAADGLPQFIWHGKNYLDIMHGDLSFLEDVIPLREKVPELTIQGNPLLLLRAPLKKGLDLANTSKMDPFAQLKGRHEQIADSLTAGHIPKPHITGFEYMGHAYRNQGLASQGLDQEGKPRSTGALNHPKAWSTRQIMDRSLDRPEQPQGEREEPGDYDEVQWELPLQQMDWTGGVTTGATSNRPFSSSSTATSDSEDDEPEDATNVTMAAHALSAAIEAPGSSSSSSSSSSRPASQPAAHSAHPFASPASKNAPSFTSASVQKRARVPSSSAVLPASPSSAADLSPRSKVQRRASIQLIRAAEQEAAAKNLARNPNIVSDANTGPAGGGAGAGSNAYTVWSTLAPFVPTQTQDNVDGSRPGTGTSLPMSRVGTPDRESSSRGLNGLNGNGSLIMGDTSWPDGSRGTSGGGGRLSTAARALLPDTSDEVATSRLQRALGLLYQSLAFSKETLDADLQPAGSTKTAVERYPMKRPKDLAVAKVSATERFLAKQGGPIRTGAQPTEELVEVQYNFRGATLSTTQLRPALAHRDSDIWCRGDAGEWFGLQKGRNIRSWEFQDKLLYEGRRRAAERKQLQQALRASITKHVVDCNVPLIQRLMTEASALRGNVLALDVRQADTYLLFRDQCVASADLIARAYRGIKVRRVYHELLRKKAWGEEHMRVTEQLALPAAEECIKSVLATAVGNITKRFKVRVHACGVTLFK
jgi:hypothetical protein